MSMIGMLTQLTPAQLETVAARPQALEDMLEGQSLCLEKMWNGLQFLLEIYLARDDVIAPSILDEAVIGGEAGEVDLGYGPACVLQPDEVKTLAKALAGVDGKILREGFDPHEMETSDIYPRSIWSEGESVLHELMTSFVDLVAFYQDAAGKGNGMATYLT